MNALGYIRISIKDQSAYSLENQERNVTEYCKKNDLHLLRIFKDDGESSYSFDRPDWIRLEAFIKQNKSVKYLVIFDHDRFSRNLAEALLKIKELQDKFSIKVVATTDSIDTDFTDPSVFMMRAFKYLIAESELHRIRQRTKSGMLQGALNGRYLNRAPYGYINARDDQNKPILKIDEDKSLVVKMIFREYNRGTNVFDIKDIVKPLGYKQKGRSAVTRILSNPVYAALLKISAHKGAPEQIGKALHPAIVSENDFYAAQRRLNGYKRRGVSTNELVPLKGVVQCHECGNFLSAGNSRGKQGIYYWYYLCSKHRKNFPARELHRQMNEILDLFSFSQNRIDWYKAKLSEEIAGIINHRGELVAKTQRALRNITDKIEAIDEKYLVQPNISKVVYNRAIQSLRSQQIELHGRLSELAICHEEYWKKLNALMPRLHDLRGTYESLDLFGKQQFLKMSFNESLTYENGMFRTQSLHPMFAHNVIQLQASGLLEINEPAESSDQSHSYPERDHFTKNLSFLIELSDLFAA